MLACSHIHVIFAGRGVWSGDAIHHPGQGYMQQQTQQRWRSIYSKPLLQLKAYTLPLDGLQRAINHKFKVLDEHMLPSILGCNCAIYFF